MTSQNLIPQAHWLLPVGAVMTSEDRHKSSSIKVRSSQLSQCAAKDRMELKSVTCCRKTLQGYQDEKGTMHVLYQQVKSEFFSQLSPSTAFRRARAVTDSVPSYCPTSFLSELKRQGLVADSVSRCWTITLREAERLIAANSEPSTTEHGTEGEEQNESAQDSIPGPEVEVETEQHEEEGEEPLQPPPPKKGKRFPLRLDT